MNSKQKMVLIGAGIVVVIVLALWIGTGAEVFTKQQVPVEHVDAMFGTTTIVWKDVFVFGLDIAAIAAAVALVVGGMFLYAVRTRSAA